MELDKSKPYGEIYGVPFIKGARYTQGGVCFNVNGVALNAPAAPVEQPPEPPTAEAPAPKTRRKKS